ncbi:hypothetical protein ACFSTC_55835 [Nonomuraea ferruginea]
MTVNADRMWEALESGFSQATDLAEFVMQTCRVDYRTAYQVVGIAVREASREGLRGIDLDAARLESAAQQYAGISLGLEGRDLTEILDPPAHRGDADAGRRGGPARGRGDGRRLSRGGDRVAGPRADRARLVRALRGRAGRARGELHQGGPRRGERHQGRNR